MDLHCKRMDSALVGSKVEETILDAAESKEVTAVRHPGRQVVMAWTSLVRGMNRSETYLKDKM